MSRIVSALKHPKAALLYFLVGGSWEHTCMHAEPLADYPIFKYITKNTDIHEHLTTLYMLTVRLKLRSIVELGTRDGESTITLLMAAKELHGKVHSFDIDECRYAKQRIAGLRLGRYWKFAQADDLNVDWSGNIDHLFIDTSHTYEQTKEELEKYEPYVRKGGLITMHDPVTFSAVKRAAVSYFRGRKDIRIYEYVNNNGLFVIFKS